MNAAHSTEIEQPSSQAQSLASLTAQPFRQRKPRVLSCVVAHPSRDKQPPLRQVTPLPGLSAPQRFNSASKSAAVNKNTRQQFVRDWWLSRPHRRTEGYDTHTTRLYYTFPHPSLSAGQPPSEPACTRSQGATTTPPRRKRIQLFMIPAKPHSPWEKIFIPNWQAISKKGTAAITVVDVCS